MEIFDGVQSSGAGLDACLSAMLCGTTQVIGTFLSTILIEKFGRKVLLLISELSTCLSMLGVGVFFFLYERCRECQGGLPVEVEDEPALTVSKEIIETIGFLPLVSLMAFIAMFSLGLGPIPWIVNVELTPPEARVRVFIIVNLPRLLSVLGRLRLTVHHVQLAGLLPSGSIRAHTGKHHRLGPMLLHLLWPRAPRNGIHTFLCP